MTIWTNDEYLQFMYERLVIMRELLSSTGTIYVHCDYHKSMYIRCILDEIFGFDCMKNEITWHYEKWTAPSGDSFQKIMILFLCIQKEIINLIQLKK